MKTYESVNLHLFVKNASEYISLFREVVTSKLILFVVGMILTTFLVGWIALKKEIIDVE